MMPLQRFKNVVAGNSDAASSCDRTANRERFIEFASRGRMMAEPMLNSRAGAFAAFTQSHSSPFVQQRDFDADLRSCFRANALVNLAAVAVITGTTAYLADALEPDQRHDLDWHLVTAAVLAEGDQPALDQLASTLMADGLEELGHQGGPTKPVHISVRCKLAAKLREARRTRAARGDAVDPPDVASLRTSTSSRLMEQPVRKSRLSSASARAVRDSQFEAPNELEEGQNSQRGLTCEIVQSAHPEHFNSQSAATESESKPLVVQPRRLRSPASSIANSARASLRGVTPALDEDSEPLAGKNFEAEDLNRLAQEQADILTINNPSDERLRQRHEPDDPSDALGHVTSTDTESLLGVGVHDHSANSISFRSLLRRKIPPRRSVLGNIAERGSVTLFAAPPGMGKTTIGMHFIIAVVTGSSWAGLKVNEPGTVMYYNAEESIEEIQRRLAALIKCGLLTESALDRGSHFFRHGAVRFMTKDGGHFSVTEHGEAFRKAILEQKPTLVVVDPIALTHELNENLNADITYVVEFFKIIAIEADCAVIIMHHTTKEAKTSGKSTASASMYASRGSTALPALARSVWQLMEIDGSNHIALSCVKANHFARGHDLHFRRFSVRLDNGDEVGLLESVTPTDLANAKPNR